MDENFLSMFHPRSSFVVMIQNRSDKKKSRNNETSLRIEMEIDVIEGSLNKFTRFSTKKKKKKMYPNFFFFP